MKIVDKRTMTATEEFGELPIGAVFEYPVGSRENDWYNACLKINSADCDDNAFDLEDGTTFTVAPNVQVCELNAHLVIEGRE